MTQKEFVTYHIVDLTSEDVFTELKGFVDALELRGEADSETLAQAFFFWRSRVREIVYRKGEGTKAFSIFSALPEAEFLHESDVLGPVRWSDDDLASFEELQNKDVTPKVTLDLKKLLPKISEEDAANVIVQFWRSLYAINPHKEEVRLSGEVPAFLLLMALDWFAVGTKRIFYNDTQLV